MVSVAIVVAFGVYVIATQEITLEVKMQGCESEGARTQQCLAELVVTEAREKGLVAGFDALGAIYETDSEFARYCHGNTHQLGEIAYEKFSHSKEFELSSKTSYCGFGFYHGFLEALMFDTGDLSQARAFCEYINAQLKETIAGISFACYHGIGHGVVDGSDPSRWGDVDAYIEPGLELCAVLSPVEEQKTRCASGVFNALAIAYSDPKYRLESDPKDPYAVCRRMEEQHVKRACYDQMNSFVVKSADSFSDALVTARDKTESAFTEEALGSVAAFEVLTALSHVGGPEQALQQCTTLDEYLAKSCIRGLAVGFIEAGKPGEESERALRACSSLTAYKVDCYLSVAQAVRYRLPPEEHTALCIAIEADMGVETGNMCREIMNTVPWTGE